MSQCNYIQEQSLGIHYNKGNDLLDYVKDRSIFEYENGFVKIPDGPGLGIEIDEDYVKEKQKKVIIGKIQYGNIRMALLPNGKGS